MKKSSVQDRMAICIHCLHSKAGCSVAFLCANALTCTLSTADQKHASLRQTLQCASGPDVGLGASPKPRPALNALLGRLENPNALLLVSRDQSMQACQSR